MSRLIIKNGCIVTPETVLEGNMLVIEKGTITAVTPHSELRSLSDDKIIDAHGLLVCPGLIEMHTNGALGYDFLDADENQVLQICDFQARHGTTSFLATLCTAPQAQTLIAARVICNVIDKHPTTAQLLGIHMEGPYFNPKFHRIHPLQHIRQYTNSELDEVITASGSLVKLFTLAPEMPGATGFVNYLQQKGIIPAMGHSNATYEEALLGVDAGIHYSTHIFAAEREFHHREPGIVGASLMDDRVWVEVLSDGLHLHPATVKMIWALKGIQRIVIATDAMAGAGLPDGEYLLAGQKVIVRDGRTISPEGRIAGGIGTMDRALHNFHEWTNVSIPEAVQMASLNPARVLGLDNRKGSLEPGKDADLFICDRSFIPKITVVKGDVVFQN